MSNSSGDEIELVGVKREVQYVGTRKLTFDLTVDSSDDELHIVGEAEVKPILIRNNAL